MLLSLTIDALTLGAMYVLVGLGYVLIYSVLGIFHLVHGDVVVVGGFIALGTLSLVGVPAGWTGPLVVLGAAVVAASACAALSWAIEVGVYRRLRSRSILTPLLAALGLALIVENVLQLVTSKDPVPFPQAATPQGYVALGDTRLAYTSILVIAVAAILLAATAAFAARTRVGAAMKAVAQDREACDLIGVPTRRVTAAAFVIAGMLAGTAGVLYAMQIGSLKWSMGLTLGIKGFSAALIGGLGSIAGAGVGGMLLAAIEIFGVGISVGGHQLDSGWRDAVAFTFVIVVLLWRPEGLLGRGSRLGQVRN